MKREINKLLFLFSLSFLISCTEDSQIDVKQVLEVNNFNVIVFVKNVGATSDYSMNISIIEGNKKITNRDKGNIFIAKGMRNVFIKLKDNFQFFKIFYYFLPHIIAVISS